MGFGGWRSAAVVALSLALLGIVLGGCFAAKEQPAPIAVGQPTATASPLPASPTRAAPASPTATDTPRATATERTPVATATVERPEVLQIPLPMRIRPQRREVMRFTVVYDNNDHDPRLIQLEGQTVLFDTGGDGDILLENMAALGLDPRRVGTVVLSHIHGDHTGGLEALLALGTHPTVYLPHSFPQTFKDGVRGLTDAREVTGPAEILPGLYTTGEIGTSIREQALAVKTSRGLVVVTGCAHPGVARLVRVATEFTGRRPYLVMGGFHLGGASRKTVEAIIAEFREMGVQKVAPCHCTGEKSTRIFAEAFGEDFISCGVGLRLAEEGSGRGAKNDG